MRAPLTGTKRGDGRWQITVTLTTAKGEKVRRTLYAATQKQVHADARKLLNETGRNAHEPHTMAELLELYKGQVWPHRKPGTIRQQQPAFARIESYFRCDPRKIDPPAVNRWLRDMQIEKDNDGSPAVGGRTIQAYRNVLSTLMGYAVSIGWASQNPAKGLALPAGVSAKPKARPRLSPLSYRILLDKETNKVLRDLWEFLGETGMRISEALQLRRDDMFYSLDLWWIRGGMKTDAGRNREIMIPDKLAHRLEAREGEWLFPIEDGTRPYNYRHVADLWAEALERAGVEYTNLHQLRKLALSRWVHAGLPEDVVKTLAGHSDFRVTMNLYNQVGRDRLMMSLFSPESVTTLSALTEGASEKPPF